KMSIIDHGHYRQQRLTVRAVTTDGYEKPTYIFCRKSYASYGLSRPLTDGYWIDRKEERWD
ncbi:hypothetical protein, partial [uncultured Jannaschia sp.]|uniref:hypothetical protein n=1 Tax=uncultured Jannaschia sp. TaxID=293347 RepID=UPI00260D0B70